MSLEAFTVSASKPHECVCPEGAYFTIRHVTLEGDSKTQLYMKYDDEEQLALICTLSGALPQEALDLPLYGEKITLIAKGNGTLHIVGNYDEIEDNDFDDFEDDEDMEEDPEMLEDEEEEEEEPVKEEKPKKEEKKPKKEEKVKVQQQPKKEVKPQEGNKKNKKHGKKN